MVVMHQGLELLQCPYRSRSHSKLASFYVTQSVGPTMYQVWNVCVGTHRADQAACFLLCSEGGRMQQCVFL